MRSSTPPAAVRVGGLALAGIVLVSAGLIYLGGGDASSGTQIELASAKRGTVVSGVSAAGNTVDANIRDLAFGASGTVEKVYVAVGQKVKKGQVLARIDDTIAREDYTAAKASLAAAQETLDKLEEAQTTGSGSGTAGSGFSGSGTTGGTAPATRPTTQPSTGPSAQPSCPPTASGSPRPSSSGSPGATPTPTAPEPSVGFTITPHAVVLAAAEVSITGDRPPAIADPASAQPEAPADSPTPTPTPSPTPT
ncbi:biotin/lipoyl-binding protein, partial [Sphaerisporangium sp. NPDC049002]|uniref:biotin/lipoyl-binding protein n=1 Tax=Sphaerisporangium sp. NPDC049002 TaxID=3155392 RepID=UPI0033DC56FE